MYVTVDRSQSSVTPVCSRSYVRIDDPPPFVMFGDERRLLKLSLQNGHRTLLGNVLPRFSVDLVQKILPLVVSCNV